MRTPWRYLILVALVLGWGGVARNPYQLQLLTVIGIHTLLALGLNLLIGFAGQISLGHAAFYGIGAYLSGILTTHFGWSPWAAGPAAWLAAAAVAVLVGVPTLRLTGYYLGMGTLGFGMIMFVLFREWSGITGGASGLVGIPALTLGPVELSSGRNGFWLVWLTVLAAFLFAERLIDSRLGRALRAIHDSERAAAAVGVDTGRLKVMVFTLSALLAALAGSLYAHTMTFISPSSFDFMVSIRIVTMVVVGGMASVWGALFGAALITLLPEWLHVFADYEMVIYGLILMLVMIFLPQGLTRALMDVYEHSQRSFARSDSAARG